MTIVVPLVDQQKIRSVILNDEGGFIFDHDSSQESDPDGGWTFAGVTRHTWEGYFKHPMSLATMQALVGNDPATAEETVIEIYYSVFAKPLQDFCSTSFITRFPYQVFELSCAINLGTQAAKDLIQTSVNVTAPSGNYKGEFLRSWMLRYVKLVTDNAIAWRTYALSGRPSDRPKAFRAGNLKGWFNRVERYR